MNQLNALLRHVRNKIGNCVHHRRSLCHLESINGEAAKGREETKKRLIVISPTPSHPQNAGNRSRIQ